MGKGEIWPLPRSRLIAKKVSNGMFKNRALFFLRRVRESKSERAPGRIKRAIYLGYASANISSCAARWGAGNAHGPGVVEEGGENFAHIGKSGRVRNRKKSTIQMHYVSV